MWVQKKVLGAHEGVWSYKRRTYFILPDCNSRMVEMRGTTGGPGSERSGSGGSPRAAAAAVEPRCVVGGAHAFILRISSYAGLAPLRFERAANGWTVGISLPMCVYSYCLVTVLVVGAVWGLVAEMRAGLDRSVRMTSRMAQVVSTCDILVVVLTAGAGVYGAPARMKKMLRFMDMVAAVDSSLGMEYSVITERKSCALVIALLVSVTALLADDSFLYAVQARKFDRQWEVIANYTGFYLLYYIVVMLELQFAFTATAVRRRFRAVNDALALTARHVSLPTMVGNTKEYGRMLAVEKTPERAPVSMFAVRVAPADPRARNKNVSLLVDSFTLYPDPSTIVKNGPDGTGRLTVAPCEAVRRLAALHGSLCGAVRLLDASYGLPLLTILVSALLHLIVTPYFLIMEIITSTNRVHFLVLQFCWVVAHMLRMFVVVEPCHHTMNEGRRTEELVCRLLGVAPAGGALPARLELFARQLLLRSVSFSPLGMCTLDRPLIATVIGAVTTYLVILIQFQRSDM